MTVPHFYMIVHFSTQSVRSSPCEWQDLSCAAQPCICVSHKIVHLRLLFVELLQVMVSDELDLLQSNLVLLFQPLLLDLGLVDRIILSLGLEPVGVDGAPLESWLAHSNSYDLAYCTAPSCFCWV